jgi:hypothetical protein
MDNASLTHPAVLITAMCAFVRATAMVVSVLFASILPYGLAEADSSRRDLSLPFGSSQEFSIACGENGSAQTKSLKGPGGISVSMIVFADDDANKDSHQCMTSYFIKIIPDPGFNGRPYTGFFSSDDDWERPVNGRLEGFSQDGKIVLGMISESGAYPFTQVFEHETASLRHAEFDVTSEMHRLTSLKCRGTLRIEGTARHGEIVLASASDNGCHAKLRLIIGPGTNGLQPLPPDEIVTPLLNAKP